ncbi:hypothetical protein CW304_08670 [Bacillus sp. UFRGS-B20]|nr:hypothetical protein CW304_08670 [Bacillus sp. UFRGS-B20]
MISLLVRLPEKVIYLVFLQFEVCCLPAKFSLSCLRFFAFFFSIVFFLTANNFSSIFKPSEQKVFQV